MNANESQYLNPLTAKRQLPSVDESIIDLLHKNESKIAKLVKTKPKKKQC